MASQQLESNFKVGYSGMCWQEKENGMGMKRTEGTRIGSGERSDVDGGAVSTKGQGYENQEQTIDRCGNGGGR